MTDAARAKERADQWIRVLANDDGTWGIDFGGQWFPCDEETEAWVREHRDEIAAHYAKILVAYAAEQTAGLLARLRRAWTDGLILHATSDDPTWKCGCRDCTMDRLLFETAPEGPG
jgi:hypothetical protein